MVEMHRLEADIDFRLFQVWAMVWSGAPTLGNCLRFAYAQGYQDALVEARDGRAGELLKEHGLVLPK